MEVAIQTRIEELEARRQSLALDVQSDPQTADALKDVENELLEVRRVAELQALADRERERRLEQQAEAEIEAEHKRRRDRIRRLAAKRVRLATTIDKALDELLPLLQEHKQLSADITSLSKKEGFHASALADRTLLAGHLRFRFQELFPQEFHAGLRHDLRRPLVEIDREREQGLITMVRAPGRERTEA